MIKTSMFKILLLAITGFSVINLSCKKQSSEEPILSTSPTFDDPIPYNLLGQGKLVFKRIGPLGNAYSRINVIDIDQKRCWNIDCGSAMAPSVSPNGDKIAFMKWGTDQTIWDIYTMDIDGKNQIDITNLEGWEDFPSWSYDGTQILFSRDIFYSNTNYIHGLYHQSPVLNTSNLVQVLDYNKIGWAPFYLANNGIVSSSSAGKLLLGPYTFDADGSNNKLVLPQDVNNDHKICSPAISPDGSKIAVLSFKMNSDIAVVLFNPDGTNPDTLVSVSATGISDWLGERNQVSLCWSPDGSKIAFTRPDGVEVGSHIYIIGTDHSGLTQVTSAEGVTDFSLSWSRK